MNILALNPGHDGVVVYLKGGHLSFSIEQEKDSSYRYESLRPRTIIKALSRANEIPDALAIGGWVKFIIEKQFPVESGYFGIEPETFIVDELNLFGKKMRYFSSPHERSHILCSYGLAPFEQGEPCYVLNWEGTVGSFYEVDGKVNIRRIASVMDQPGAKYQFLFHLADAGEQDDFSLGLAGKLMALAGFADRSPLTSDGRKLIDALLAQKVFWEVKKKDFSWSPFYRMGVEDQRFKNLAYHFAEEIFGRFYDCARENLEPGRPLLIAGGCGLNCAWNTRWKECGLFSDVFVPPCTNDTGSALGTAIDAQFHFTGNAKVIWNTYAGEEFVKDQEVPDMCEVTSLSYEKVADFLACDKVIAWVQGRYEMGPRALGNRSLIAAPFSKGMHQRLNTIKQRESYRPIAPICIENEASQYFHIDIPSPYMLHFHFVKDRSLEAVTHVDGSARVQTVSPTQNVAMYELLRAFKQRTGYPVLCNTSLNFNGRGFINRMSDLWRYAQERNLDGFVVNDKFYRLL